MFLVNSNDDTLLIVGIVLALVIISVVLLIVLKNKKRNDFLKQRNEANNELITCLGGLDNIVKAAAMGSRLSLVLNDYSVINEEKIKELGVSTIIKMSNKITLVIGEDAKEIAQLINKD